MATEITKSGIHKTKALKDRARTKVVPVSFFIQGHDFSMDPKYAELCEPLNYREIEFAKRYSFGDIAAWKATREICPQLSHWACQSAFNRAHLKPAFKELLTYLKEVALEHSFTGKINDDQLLDMMEESLHVLSPGKQKFDMAHKLYQLRISNRKRARKFDPDVHDPEGEDKWEASLSEFDDFEGKTENED